MIMIPGSGPISNYGSYISNCTKGQMPYKVPVNSLSDVQLYINIGAVKPSTIEYQMILTCGTGAGAELALTSGAYIIGQDTNGNWYGVFKNLALVVPGSITCFVVAIILDDQYYYSEEYCIDSNCGSGLTQLQGCYGNLDNKLSYDCEGIYFGTHAGPDTAMGDVSVKYKHQLLLRGVDVTLSSIKNTFKQGRTRNFRTEKEKVYQFWGEPIPEWYVPEVDAIFYRGEVYVGSTKYLVNDTGFEKIEDCKKMWKPSATFKDSCYQSFSCEADPCAPPVIPCCDPLGVVASVSQESPGSGPGVCCDPVVIMATVSQVNPFCQTMARDSEFNADGFWYTDKADLDAFTVIYFSKVDMTSADITTWLAALTGKLITITLDSDPTKTATYLVTGTMIDYGTYVGFDVEVVSGTPYSMLQSEEYTICWSEDTGDTFFVIDSDGSRLLDSDNASRIIYP